jgi:hypothetical protein
LSRLSPNDFFRGQPPNMRESMSGNRAKSKKRGIKKNSFLSDTYLIFNALTIVVFNEVLGANAGGLSARQKKTTSMGLWVLRNCIRNT